MKPKQNKEDKFIVVLRELFEKMTKRNLQLQKEFHEKLRKPQTEKEFLEKLKADWEKGKLELEIRKEAFLRASIEYQNANQLDLAGINKQLEMANLLLLVVGEKLAEKEKK